MLGWKGRWSAIILKKRSIEHGKLLSRKFLKPSDKRGLGYGEMQEVDAGAAMEMMCPTCLTPMQGPREEEVSFLQVDGGSGALHSAHGEHVGGWQTLGASF